MRLYKLFTRISGFFLIFSLITTNILTLTNAQLHDLLYRGLLYLPLAEMLTHSPTAKYNKLNTKHVSLKTDYDKKVNNVKTTRKIAKRITSRTARNIIFNIASIPAESIPYLGAVAVIVATAYDINDACDNMKDIDEMMTILEIETTNKETNKVCGLSV